MKKTVDYTEKRCAICGRSFVVAVDWAYKLQPRNQRMPVYFCSWKHSRQYESEHAERKLTASASHC